MSQPQEIRDIVRQEVQRLMKDSMPHICTYCGWFRMNDTVPHNRFCKYPDKLPYENRQCMAWVLAEDYKNRRQGDITV